MYIACMTKEKDARIYKVVDERAKKFPETVSLVEATFYDIPYDTEQGAWDVLLENGFFLDLPHVGQAIAKRVKEGISKRKSILESPSAYLPESVKIMDWYHAVIRWQSSDPRFSQLDIETKFDETDYLLSSEKNKKRLLEAMKSKEDIPLEVVRERLGI